MNKGKLYVFIVAAGLLVAIFLPQLLGYGFWNGDPVFAFYPILTFYGEALETGNQFLWAPYLTGFPVYLDLVGGLFSPLNQILFKYLPVVPAYNAALFLSAVLLLFFSYHAARGLKISRAGSIFAATAFSFGYHLSNWGSNITVANTMFSLPLMIWTVTALAEKKYWVVPLSTIGLGYALISGQPQWVLIALLGACLFLVIDGIRRLFEGDSAKNTYIWLALIILIAVLAFILASFQILPTQTLAALSARSEGISFLDTQISAQTPFDWLWYILPDLQFKFFNASEPTLYIGILPLLLSIFATLHWKKDKRITVPLIGLFVFGIVTALRFSPVYWLLHQLPILEYFRGSNRWMYVGNFGLAMLAGVGFDMVRHENAQLFWLTSKRWLGYILMTLLSVTIVVNTVAFFFWRQIMSIAVNYFDKVILPHTKGGLSLEHYHNSLESILANNFRNISFTNSKFLLAILFITAAYVLVSTIARSGWREKHVYIVLSIAALNLIVLHPNYHETVSADVLMQKPGILKYIEPNANGRVFTLFGGSAVDQKLRQQFRGEFNSRDYVIFQRDLLLPNIPMQYGVDLIDGYNNLMPRRVARILAILGSERATTGDLLAYEDGLMNDKIQKVTSRLNILSMLNVKYLISAYELNKIPGLELETTISSTRFNIPIYLYENKSFMPRVYFARGVTFISDTDEENNFKVIIKSSNDFTKNTFIECSSCSNSINLPSRKDTLKLEEYQTGHVSLTVNVENGRWLVFSESNLPGWRVTIDGRQIVTRSANYIFQGIYLPSGQHNVTMEYNRL